MCLTMVFLFVVIGIVGVVVCVVVVIVVVGVGVVGGEVVVVGVVGLWCLLTGEGVGEGGTYARFCPEASVSVDRRGGR